MANERNLLAYVVDIEDSTGDIGSNNNAGETFRKGIQSLLQQCIQHKIFSASKDTLCVVRTDSLRFKFSLVNWDTLRHIDTNIFPVNPSSGSSSNRKDLRQIFAATLASMRTQSKEDSYTEKKVMFIGDLKGDVQQQQLTELAEKLRNENVLVNFIVPGEKACNAKQKQNLATITNFFTNLSYVSVYTIEEALLQLATSVCKKPVRPSPWNAIMEIGPDLKINVSGYLCVRKNKASETKQALLKTVEHLPLPLPEHSQNVNKEITDKSPSKNTEVSTTAKEKVVPELTSKVVSKEEIWKEDDGTIVPAEQIADAYYYGGKLVPFDEIQKSESYTTGEKCFKVLVFCPKEQIQPYQIIDDGNDLFFPKKGEPDSDVLFSALVQTLHKSGKVAIVRKIYRKNTKILLGVLSPDLERKCLVYDNLCFAEDLSLPKFPLLFKPEELQVTSEKDNLMDQYINSLSIDNYLPNEGPVDPAVQTFRQSITQKICGSSTSSAIEISKKSKDNIVMYFENLIKENTKAITTKDDGENMPKQLCLTFPVRKIEEKKNERLAGAQIFRKRNLDGTVKEEETDDKKIKVELNEEVPTIEDEGARDEFDVDNLLDDL